MSVHDGTSYDYKVGAKVQEYVDDGYKEILVSEDKDGGWNITSDKKLFWSCFLTPSEKEELQKENKLIRDYAGKIKREIDLYFAKDDEDEAHETICKINTCIQNLIR